MIDQETIDELVETFHVLRPIPTDTGRPVSVVVEGETYFVDCAECEEALRGGGYDADGLGQPRHTPRASCKNGKPLHCDCGTCF